jgi:hypothetical protein
MKRWIEPLLTIKSDFGSGPAKPECHEQIVSPQEADQTASNDRCATSLAYQGSHTIAPGSTTQRNRLRWGLSLGTIGLNAKIKL